MKILIKSAGPYQGQKMEELVALAKALINPADLSVGGELTPQAAERIISMVFKTDFLSKITTVRMSKLRRNVSVIDIARRQLKRIAQGTEPGEADLADASQHGVVLEALDAQLFPTLTLDFLRENQDNSELIKLVEEGFATQLSNDIVDLGFNGTSDANDNGFLTLNEGWLSLAEAAADTQKVDIDPATDGWQATLAAIMDASDTRWRRDSVFVMNEADADAYARELGGHVTGTPLTAESPLRRYQGRPIEAQPDMAPGEVMFTPLKNLVYGLHTRIERQREFKARKRALEYTFDLAFDYEIAVKKALVYGRAAAA